MKKCITFAPTKLLFESNFLDKSVLKTKIIHLPGLRFAQHTWGVFSFIEAGKYDI